MKTSERAKNLYMLRARAYNQQAFHRKCPTCMRRMPCAVDASNGTFRCLICGTEGLTTQTVPEID